MKQLLFFSFLLISFAGVAQTKSMRDYTPRAAQLSDTLFENRSTTGTTTLQLIKGLYFPGTTLQYMRGDGSLATFPTSNTAFTNGAGYLLPADITGKQNTITLTTIGSSGAATLVGSTLNIPQYAGGAGGGMTAANFIVGEVPAGTKNDSNTTFTFANAPTTNKEIVYVNGIRQKRGTDYTITGATITMSIAPRSTDDLLTDYIF